MGTTLKRNEGCVDAIWWRRSRYTLTVASQKYTDSSESLYRDASRPDGAAVGDYEVLPRFPKCQRVDAGRILRRRHGASDILPDVSEEQTLSYPSVISIYNVSQRIYL